MNDYISRSRLIGTLESFIQYLPVGIETQYIEALKAAVELVRLEPAADVAPVKRGKWTLHKDGSATCSVCGFIQNGAWDLDNWDNYCHHCGADMRGGNMTGPDNYESVDSSERIQKCLHCELPECTNCYAWHRPRKGTLRGEEKKKLIAGYYELGYSDPQIANLLGMSVSRVNYYRFYILGLPSHNPEKAASQRGKKE